MNQCVWHFPSTVLHPARSGAGEALFFVCGFQSCSRKRGRLDWHQPNILQLAQVAWCSSAPKITAVLLGHGSFSPHHYHTRTLGGVTGWERGFEGLCRWCWWLLPLPWGCVRGRSSLPSFPGELGGVYGPAYHAAPLIPLIGAGGRVQPCGIRILPAGLQKEGAQAPRLMMPTHPPAHGPGATGHSHGGSGHMVTQ